MKDLLALLDGMKPAEVSVTPLEDNFTDAAPKRAASPVPIPDAPTEPDWVPTPDAPTEPVSNPDAEGKRWDEEQGFFFTMELHDTGRAKLFKAPDGQVFWLPISKCRVELESGDEYAGAVFCPDWFNVIMKDDDFKGTR